MSFKLYFDAMSQPSRALMLFVRANKLPCKEVLTSIRKGEHRTEEFEKINRFQKLPAIEHNGFCLSESVAILQYLCREFPVADKWYPKDSKMMARVDEYCSWQHLNLRAYGSLYFVESYIKPMMTGEAPKPAKLEKAAYQLTTILDQIENIWLKDKKFMAGDNLTIADLLASTELEQPGVGGFDIYKERPKLAAYMDRVRGELNPIYDEVHSILYKVKKMQADKAKASN